MPVLWQVKYAAAFSYCQEVKGSKTGAQMSLPLASQMSLLMSANKNQAELVWVKLLILIVIGYPTSST